MGRRKIEIKAIKDDRNRSVTFLKRKGGLFKKAHELSVLCSVDVAVIIFGHNKKLYEFSSGNIQETIQRYQYYGGPHEHKGPADFAGKREMDGSDEEEIDEGAIEDMGADPSIQPPFPGAPYPHVRQTASASPPVSNGTLPYHRQRTPQPGGMGSRPASRNQNGAIPRPSSNLNPAVAHPPPPHPPPPNMPNGYAYMPNQGVYPNHGLPTGQHPPHPQFAYPQHAASHPPMPHPPYLHDQHNRRMSGPGAPYPPMDRPRSQTPQARPSPPQRQPSQQGQQQQGQPSPPQHPHIQQPPPPPPHSQQPPPPAHPAVAEPEPRPAPGMLQPYQPKPDRLHKTRSIFTPIDDSRSLLAQHWGMGPIADPTPPRAVDVPAIKTEHALDAGRAQSVEIGNVGRAPPGEPAAPPAPGPTRPSRVLSQPQRTTSMTSLGGGAGGGGNRPKLKVQIPSEQSDDGAETGTASSPAQGTGGAGGQPRPPPGQPAIVTSASSGSGAPATTKTSGSESSGPPAATNGPIHLPPPSPSASALLSAGASGPANPFARPLPPPAPPGGGSGGGPGGGGPGRENAAAYASNSNIETPISALPSRFAENLLPSPSSFYPDWGFGGGASNSNHNGGGGGGGGRGGSVSGAPLGADGALLPSPLTFPTPQAVLPLHGFGRDEGGAGAGEKRKGSAEGVVGGEAKKIKA